MSKVRQTPGQSITGRISGRFHTRRVGPRAGFFHRFGLQDPFAVAAPQQRPDRHVADQTSPFVWLSSAAYHEEVAAARYRMLARTAERSRSRVGERLERVGPIAANVAPIRTLVPLTPTVMTTLEDTPEVEQQDEVAAAPTRRAKPAQAAAAGRRRQRPIPAPTELPVAAAPRRAEKVPPVAAEPRQRPVARAFQRVQPAQRTARSLARMVKELRGKDRRAVASVLEKVIATAPSLVEDAPETRRALGEIRRTVSSLRPAARATMRAAEPRSVAPAGLRRVLESSPTMIAMERPEDLLAQPDLPVASEGRRTPRAAAPAARRARPARAAASRPAAQERRRVSAPVPTAGRRTVAPAPVAEPRAVRPVSRAPITAHAARRAVTGSSAIHPALRSAPRSVHPALIASAAVPHASATELGAAPAQRRSSPLARVTERAQVGRTVPTAAAPIASASTRSFRPTASLVEDRWTEAVEAPPVVGERATARAVARTAAPRTDVIAASAIPYVMVEEQGDVLPTEVGPVASPGVARTRGAPASAGATRPSRARRSTPAASTTSASLPSPAPEVGAPQRRRAARFARPLSTPRGPSAAQVDAGSVRSLRPVAFPVDLVPSSDPLAAVEERRSAQVGARRELRPTGMSPVWLEPEAPAATEEGAASAPRARKAAKAPASATSRTKAGRAAARTVQGRSAAPAPAPSASVTRRDARVSAPAPVATRPARRALDRATVTPRTDARGSLMLRASPTAHVHQLATVAPVAPAEALVGTTHDAGPAPTVGRRAVEREPSASVVGRRSERRAAPSADRPTPQVEPAVGERRPAARRIEATVAGRERTQAPVGSVAHAAMRATPTARVAGDPAAPRVLAAPVATTLATPEQVTAEVEQAEVRGASQRRARTATAAELRRERREGRSSRSSAVAAAPAAGREAAPTPSSATEPRAAQASVSERAEHRARAGDQAVGQRRAAPGRAPATEAPAERRAAEGRPAPTASAGRGSTERVATPPSIAERRVRVARAQEAEVEAGPMLRAAARAERGVQERVALAAPPTSYLAADTAPLEADGVAPSSASGRRREAAAIVAAARRARAAEVPAAEPSVRTARSTAAEAASPRARARTRRDGVPAEPSAARTMAEASVPTPARELPLLPSERAATRDRAVARLDSRGQVSSGTAPVGVLAATLGELRWLEPAAGEPEAAAVAPRSSRGARVGPVGSSRPAPSARVRAHAASLRRESLPGTVLPQALRPLDLAGLLRGLDVPEAQQRSARRAAAPATVASRRVLSAAPTYAMQQVPLDEVTGLPATDAPRARLAGGRAPTVQQQAGRVRGQAPAAVAPRGRRAAATSAVHAALRGERSRLVSETSRRVAHGSTEVVSGGRGASIEARVIQGADGRIQRVVARTADGALIHLAPTALGLDAAPRSSATAWVEGRGGVPTTEGSSPAARIAGRVAGPAAAAQRRAGSVDVLPGVRRTGGDAPVALGPMTLAAAPVDDDTTAASAPGARAAGRSDRRRLGSTLAEVATERSPVQRARGRRRGAGRTLAGRALGAAGAVTPAPGVEPSFLEGAPEGAAAETPAVGGARRSPSWARRAVDPTVVTAGEAVQPAEPRVRVAGGLMTALARAGDPEDVVRVILERNAGLAAAASELPREARTLVERIARSAVAQEAAAQRVANLPQYKTSTKRSPTPTSVAHRGASGHSGAGATVVQGVGASGMMQLAGKLMKLIHLAQNERRLADAQRQVRMAEAGTTPSTSAPTGGESVDDKTMNMQMLKQHLLDSLLDHFNNQQHREGNPDGPSI
ncbi:MAG: hypothetical protein H6735_17020 [Alphaproteobacteria bacterium]|nr:hypothetical protein [Alphaproteobacteria bacterium]